MSTAKNPAPVKLIASVFAREARLLDTVVHKLMEAHGEADFVGELLSFDFTTYYQREFGAPLVRRFIAFRNLISPEEIVSIKLANNNMESSYLREDGSRRINIDPGYIAAPHLLLATCKGFAHRPYLGSGVYADLTLIFRNGHYHPLEWTYPDYASLEMREMFEKIRGAYMLTLNMEEVT